MKIVATLIAAFFAMSAFAATPSNTMAKNVVPNQNSKLVAKQASKKIAVEKGKKKKKLHKKHKKAKGEKKAATPAS